MGDAGIAELEIEKRDAGSGEVGEDVVGHRLGGDCAKVLEVDAGHEDGPAGGTVPCRPEHRVRRDAVALDQGGHGLGADPRVSRGPDQRSVGLADLVGRERETANDLADRPALGRGWLGERHGRASQGRGNAPIWVERDNDDRDGAA